MGTWVFNERVKRRSHMQTNHFSALDIKRKIQKFNINSGRHFIVMESTRFSNGQFVMFLDWSRCWSSEIHLEILVPLFHLLSLGSGITKMSTLISSLLLLNNASLYPLIRRLIQCHANGLTTMLIRALFTTIGTIFAVWLLLTAHFTRLAGFVI